MQTAADAFDSLLVALYNELLGQSPPTRHKQLVESRDQVAAASCYFVISGGKATPATLFYNVASRKIGILGYRDVVFFDEIASTSFSDPDATISVLKDYMQTGRFSRGPLEFTAQASIVLGGNIDTDLEQRAPSDRYLHLFEALPLELGADTAFLDRLHGFLPGWELPKIRPENFAQGYGFITDYLAEIFTRLRRRNYQTVVNAHVDFSSLTGRNQDAIRKTTAGLLKLIFPQRTADDLDTQELDMCLDLAVECRARVIEQLAVLAPGEFKPLHFQNAAPPRMVQA